MMVRSQKGIRKKKREVEEGHTRDKDDFDGTPQSLGSCLPQSGEAHAQEEDFESNQKKPVFIVKDFLIAL